MSRLFRRFEILLPTRFNDGNAVPQELIGETIIELRTKFGAVSSETQLIAGQWTHENRVYKDELVRIFVDVPDVPENRDYFLSFKETIKSRFNQIDIWMTTYPLDVI